MGEVTSIWYMKDNYMCSLTETTTVYFKSIRDHLELAYYDTINSVLYLNSKYKNRFKKAYKNIIKDFKPETISEYLDL